MPKVSAGLLAYRVTEAGTLEFLLVHPGGPFWRNKDLHAWSIPKGELTDGADPLSEAEREFSEELGLEPPSGPRLDLGSVRQASGKHVRVWAVDGSDLVVDEIVSNEFEMEWPPKSGQTQLFPEVDRAEWMAIEAARVRVVAAQAAFFDRLVDALSG